MDSVYIVMPAYNEEQNIESVINAWYPQIEDKSNASRLVVADGGSTDATHDILLKLQTKYDKLEVISETAKQHGPKLIALYNYALEKKADYIFQTDSDGQTNASEFKIFWEMRNMYDAVIGKRSKRGDGVFRLFVEKVLCLILRFYFGGIKVPDSNAPFRLMKGGLVKKYLSKLPQDYNLPNVMLTTYFQYYHENVYFMEISFNCRQGGKNSINLFKIIEIGRKALADFCYFKRNM